MEAVGAGVTAVVEILVGAAISVAVAIRDFACGSPVLTMVTRRAFSVWLTVLTCLFGLQALAGTYLSVYQGSRMYEWDGKYLSHYQGKRLFEWDGKYLAQYQGRRLFEWDGRYVSQYQGRRVLELDGRHVSEYQGKRLFAFDGKYVARYQGSRVFEQEGVIPQVILALIATGQI